MFSVCVSVRMLYVISSWIWYSLIISLFCDLERPLRSILLYNYQLVPAKCALTQSTCLNVCLSATLSLSLIQAPKQHPSIVPPYTFSSFLKYNLFCSRCIFARVGPNSTELISFLDATPYSLIDLYKRFTGNYCIHLHCRRIEINLQAVYSYKTLLNFYQTVRRHISDLRSGFLDPKTPLHSSLLTHSLPQSTLVDLIIHA